VKEFFITGAQCGKELPNRDDWPRCREQLARVR
jgi:hypothetical protein